MGVFMLQGLLIGLVGTAVGAGSGFLAAMLLDRYKLIRVPMDVYQIAYIPFVVEPVDFVVVIVGAVAICFVATIYPSRQAAKLDPVEGLRFGMLGQSDVSPALGASLLFAVGVGSTLLATLALRSGYKLKQ